MCMNKPPLNEKPLNNVEEEVLPKDQRPDRKPEDPQFLVRVFDVWERDGWNMDQAGQNVENSLNHFDKLNYRQVGQFYIYPGKSLAIVYRKYQKTRSVPPKSASGIR